MESFGFPTEAVVILIVVVSVSVFIDLFAHRNTPEMTLRDAAVWSGFWIALSIGFYFYLDWRYGAEPASLFLAGYALEKSLSIDNMMVFVAIFSSFGITGMLRHRILYYGIIGAVVFRAIFIVLGTSLFGLAGWVELVFAVIVGWSAWMLIKSGEEEEITDYSDHWSVRLTKRFVPVVPRLVGKRFFASREAVHVMQEADPTLELGRRAAFYATPAFLCMVAIEASDIVFSFDSVPAIIAVTQEPMLVYAAVIFAILGLRSLYFLLAVAEKYLCHLDKAVALILVFIAVKLGASAVEKTFGVETFHVHHTTSLYIVLGLLAAGVLASLVWPDDDDGDEDEAKVTGTA